MRSELARIFGLLVACFTLTRRTVATANPSNVLRILRIEVLVLGACAVMPDLKVRFIGV